MTHHLSAIPGELLKTFEVAERLNVSTRTVVFWAKRGWIESIRTPGGKDWRYPAAGVERAYQKMYGAQQ